MNMAIYEDFTAGKGRFTESVIIDGNLSVAGTITPQVQDAVDITGDFSVATSKLTVAAASGNTAIAGTLAVTGASTLTGATNVVGNLSVNTNKFAVTAASGNTAIAGTLAVTGASTLTGATGVTGNFAVATNKFTVVAASGNTAVAGTLAVVGNVGFYGKAVAAQPAINTAALTTLTFTAPGSADYALQDLTDTGGFGFKTKDEGNSALAVIANLQTRVGELETKLKALGLMAEA
jgi:hypothetical protein